MIRFERTVTLRRPRWADRWACRRRGVPVPLMMSPTPADQLAMLAVPYRWRRAHRWFAVRGGFFWLPCPVCGQEFGGHEIGGSVQRYGDDEAVFSCICRPCTMRQGE